MAHPSESVSKTTVGLEQPPSVSVSEACCSLFSRWYRRKLYAWNSPSTSGHSSLSASAPSAITCGHPGNPANGRTNGSEFNLNDVVNFTCNRGYVLSGSARAQCRLNGQWSSTLPVCKGHQLSHTTSPETQIFLLMPLFWFTYGMQSAQYCFGAL